MSLTTAFILAVLLIGTLADQASAEKPLADRIGFAHVDGKYHFTNKDFLNEGADRILETGSRVIKVFLMPHPERKYPFNSDWKQYKSQVELVSSPYFRKLLSKPFSTIILETFSFNVGGWEHYWTRGITDEQAAEESRQFYELTKYLLKTYANTGKTFILTDWENDWAIRQNTNPETVPTDTAVKGMIRWVNARQDGVDLARQEFGETGVHVYHSTEVNLVAIAMQGKKSVTNDVLPYTHCDLYSYSAYDTVADARKLRAALDYIATKAPASKAFGRNNIYIGEYGWPENEAGSEKALKIVREATEAGLEFGAPYLIFWQVYDNEAKAGKSDDKGDCRGFWLIKPSGAKSVFWDYFVGLLGGK